VRMLSSARERCSWHDKVHEVLAAILATRPRHRQGPRPRVWRSRLRHTVRRARGTRRHSTGNVRREGPEVFSEARQAPQPARTRPRVALLLDPPREEPTAVLAELIAIYGRAGGSIRVPDGVDVVEVLARATTFELLDSLAGPERPIEQVIAAAQRIAARVLGW